MSAAATAAGYLYASGRLRGRGTREQSEGEREQQQAQGPDSQQPQRHGQQHAPHPPAPKRREVRVAAYRPAAHPADSRPEQGEHHQPAAPKRVPKIEYRTRRWRRDE